MLAPYIYVVGHFSHLKGAGLKYSLLEFISDESGATAIEYGLIAAGIALAIIAVVNGVGSNLNTMFSSINTSLK
jgi:pilus assembly protein Flp/PilA